ncbi:MAG: NTP transferase domain-containing protein [Alphaproteobacteria bacterium]
MTLTALILAGTRHGQNDPVAKTAGVPYKALAEINGTPMIRRVITALKESGNIDKITVSTPDDLPLNKDIQRISCAKSPARSVLNFLDTIDENTPFLLTTADHALLSPAIIKSFLNKYDTNRFDIGAAMLPLDILTQKYPAMRRTRLKFKDGSYKACNLFIFRNKAAAQNILQFWLNIEAQRKNPWKMIRALGPAPLLRYLTEQLSLQDALSHLGRKTQTTPQAIMLDIPEAAIDIDNPADLEFVRNLIKNEKI